MAAITHVGNKLLITRGQWRGWIGEIKEVKNLPCGLVDYVMIIDDSDDETVNKIEVTVQAEDCREYCPGSINLEAPFDITSYLSVNQMRDIAKEIYTVKVNAFLDDVFNNRTKLSGPIPVQVLNVIIEKYAEDMLGKYRHDMLDVFKKVINDDKPLVEDEDAKCFGRAIQWALERVATKYIEENPAAIAETMKDEIHENAKRMIAEKWSYSLSKALEDTAKSVVQEVFAKTEKPQE